MRSTGAPDLDVSGVMAAYEQRVRAACPDELDLAVRTLRRLTPESWTLEWYLPWWLGQAFRLDPHVSRQIVLSNVLGLASIRLQDDLLDDDVADADLAGAHRLSAGLFEEAVAVYRSHFVAASAFWPFLEGTMSDWRRASAADARRSDDLASRGAPLKASAYATCLLADRVDRWDLLERCLDRALTALVLYDDVCDWEADVAAGRWNAFVAAVTPEQQLPRERDRTRATVLAAMMTSDVLVAHFDRLHSDAIDAGGLAIELGCAPLADYLVDWARRTADQGAMMDAHYRNAADRAATLMFGSVVTGGRIR